MTADERDFALLVALWLGTAAMCGGVAWLYWTIYQHYRRKRIERERSTTE